MRLNRRRPYLFASFFFLKHGCKIICDYILNLWFLIFFNTRFISFQFIIYNRYKGIQKKMKRNEIINARDGAVVQIHAAFWILKPTSQPRLKFSLLGFTQTVLWPPNIFGKLLLFSHFRLAIRFLKMYVWWIVFRF